MPFLVHVEVFKLPVEKEYLVHLRHIRIQAEISRTWAEYALDIFMAFPRQAWRWGAERWLEVKHGEKCT